MRLIVDQSLATGFIPINTWQQRASLPFKPSVLERKVYNNEDKILFSILTVVKPECDNGLHPEKRFGEQYIITLGLAWLGLQHINTLGLGKH